MGFRSTRQRKKVMILLKNPTHKAIPDGVFRKIPGDTRSPSFKIVRENGKAYIQRTRYTKGGRRITKKLLAQ